MRPFFWACVAAAALHVCEEYVYPDGFPQWFRAAFPTFAPYITTGFLVTVNVIFLGGCVLAASLPHKPMLGLSIAALLAVNATTHLGGTIRMGTYSPGVITGLAVSWPLAVITYRRALATGVVSLRQALIAAAAGGAYQLGPVLYMLIRSTLPSFGNG